MRYKISYKKKMWRYLDNSNQYNVHHIYEIKTPKRKKAKNLHFISQEDVLCG